ncbi:hypothetical protein EIP91_006212 [Steccherinum ochraceum]|uniref:Uncharacterized protein n=1 Tax=Steccherinum ochraceum TaxID=92696 RepID=A0A4R0REG6_9APHY|nr:hypothetical protein EIP91_006212 [Steccherinum ochraceum]
MLPRNAFGIHALRRINPAAAAQFRPVIQLRTKKTAAVPAKDPSSALKNLKDPAPASSPESGSQGNQWKKFEDIEPPPMSKFQRWGLTANRAGSFIIIPAVIAYAVFLMDWGEHENVFSPARRWLLRQKAAFWTLTPAEQELLIPKPMAKVHRHLGDIPEHPDARTAEARNTSDNPPSPESST